jgi:hypothetical protein
MKEKVDLQKGIHDGGAIKERRARSSSKEIAQAAAILLDSGAAEQLARATIELLTADGEDFNTKKLEDKKEGTGRRHGRYTR